MNSAKPTIRNIPLNGKKPNINIREVTCQGGNLVILVSYSTPVAYKQFNPGIGWSYFRCEEGYSTTTSRHINHWLNRRKVPKVPQANIAAMCPVAL
jgi:hypothetical protein